MVSNFSYPDGKAVPFHLSLFNFNSSGKKLWCLYLSTLFNLLGCQANKIARSMLYTKCFYVTSEAKRLFSSLEAHRPGLWLSWLIWWIHILCTLKGNSHSPLQWCNIKTYCKKFHPSRLLNYSELLSLPPYRRPELAFGILLIDSPWPHVEHDRRDLLTYQLDPQLDRKSVV